MAIDREGIAENDHSIHNTGPDLTDHSAHENEVESNGVKLDSAFLWEKHDTTYVYVS
jgi:hypothetical protein